MKNSAKRPSQLDNLFSKIQNCITKGHYRHSQHAIDRRVQRHIDLPDVLYVLKHGYHEKSKTTFDDAFRTWKYAIRGKTLDNLEIRIVIAFDENDMLIITVMHVNTKK